MVSCVLFQCWWWIVCETWKWISVLFIIGYLLVHDELCYFSIQQMKELVWL